MKKLITITLFLFIGTSIQAQDFVFSQFYLSPLNLNPALAGGTDDYRLAINYRENAGGIIGVFNRTGGISLDGPIQLSDYDKLGLGIRAAFDRAGSLAFTQSAFTIALAYERRLFKDSEDVHTISFGLDGGVGQTSIDFTNAVPPTPGPIGGGLSNSFPDFSAGVAYQLKFTPETKFLMGLSIGHLFEPDSRIDGFTDNDTERRFSAHAEVDLTVSQNFWVTPRAFYWSRDGIRLYTGIASFKYRRNTQIFELGIGLRANNQSDNGEVILLGAFEFRDLKFAVSRDLNVSAVQNVIGDFYEGSVIYEF